jgi:hypothetical protein
MDTQTTFRLPEGLARALERYAAERRIPKSQVVREALEAFLASPGPSITDRVRERGAPYLGALSLRDGTDDPMARLIRTRNWRP